MASVDATQNQAGSNARLGKGQYGAMGSSADLGSTGGQAAGAATGESMPLKFEQTRFGRLAQELIRVIPGHRLGYLAVKVEHETGEPIISDKRRYLLYRLETSPLLSLKCFKKKDLRHFCRHMDAPHSGSHARLAARVLEIMLAESPEEYESHRLQRRRAARRPSLSTSTASMGNPEEVYLSLAKQLGLEPSDIPGPVEQAQAAGGSEASKEDNKAAVRRARKLHTLQDHLSSAMEDASAALRRLEAVHASLQGQDMAGLTTALGLSQALDTAHSSVQAVVEKAGLGCGLVSTELEGARKAANIGHYKGRGGVTRAQVIADCLYDQLHNEEGRTVREGSDTSGSESESESESEASGAAGPARKKGKGASGQAYAPLPTATPDAATKKAVSSALEQL